MKRFSCLRVLAFTALISAIVCMTAEAQQQRGRQRGQRGEGQGQRAPGGPGGPGGGQRGPGGMRGPGMGGGGVSGLLRMQQVQDELKVTDDQKAQVAKMAEGQGAKMREMFGGMRGENRDEQTEAQRQAQREEMGKKFQALAKETEGKLREILKPEQFKRLKQIELQQQMQTAGPGALVRPDIVQALGLTEEQQQSIKGIVEGLMAQQQERMKIFEGFREASEEERAKLREKGEKLREAAETAKKEAQGKAMAVLTDDQKAKLKGLMGKFIKLEMRGGPGGGRPGGDRGGARPEGERGGQEGGNRRPRRPQE